LEGSGIESLEAYNSRLAAWNEQKDQLEAELARQIPEMNLKQQLLVADRQLVARNLPERSVLIEFVDFQVFDFQAVPARGEAQWKPAHYLAFVLQSSEPDNVQMIDLGETDTIDQRIAAFRESITGDFEAKAAYDVAFQTALDNSPSPSEPAEIANGRHAGPASNQLNEDVFLSEGRALRAIIFDPLITALKGDTRLFLAPDGNLTRIPFEVLPTNDGRNLIDDYHISYLSVGRDALRFNSASTREISAPLVVAAPDFDLSNANEGTAPTEDQLYTRQSRDLERNTLYFSPLPGTSAEGMQIALYLGTQSLLGRAAVKIAIENCQSPHILHIATHGFFLPDKKHNPNDKQSGRVVSENMGLLSATPENPLLRSGLALAGANTWLRGATPSLEAGNGLLTAEDVSGLDLLDTELAVLSACETGLGQIQTGEGVLGLRRSFMLAGVKTLVMSLWKVPDQQTQELMVDFYRRLLEGCPRLDALQEAQKALRAKYPHPRYWGAFILQGNPDPLAF
jgi:CHAT domain-containing protein